MRPTTGCVRRGAAEVAGEVGAHAYIERWGRLETEVGEEGGEAIEVVEGHAELDGQRAQDGLREIAAAAVLRFLEGLDDADTGCRLHRGFGGLEDRGRLARLGDDLDPQEGLADQQLVPRAEDGPRDALARRAEERAVHASHILGNVVSPLAADHEVAP